MIYNNDLLDDFMMTSYDVYDDLSDDCKVSWLKVWGKVVPGDDLFSFVVEQCLVVEQDKYFWCLWFLWWFVWWILWWFFMMIFVMMIFNIFIIILMIFMMIVRCPDLKFWGKVVPSDLYDDCFIIFMIIFMKILLRWFLWFVW
jgi:hypothetical protein